MSGIEGSDALLQGHRLGIFRHCDREGAVCYNRGDVLRLIRQKEVMTRSKDRGLSDKEERSHTADHPWRAYRTRVMQVSSLGSTCGEDAFQPAR